MKSCVYCKSRYRKGTKTSFHSFPKNLTERNKWLKSMKAYTWTPMEKDCICSKHFDNECFIKHSSRITLKSGSVPTIFEDPNSFEALEISDCRNVSEGKEKDVDIVEQTIPKDKCEMSTSPESPSSLSKQGGVKTLLSKSILEDNGFQKDASTTTDELERDILLRDSIRSDHFYGNSQSPKKSRFVNCVAHDHCYEKSPRSSQKTLQYTKKLLKLLTERNTAITALTRRVQRLKTKVANLKTVINDLKKRNKTSKNSTQLLKQYDKIQMEFLIECSKIEELKV